jgi:hypothetical protein
MKGNRQEQGLEIAAAVTRLQSGEALLLAREVDKRSRRGRRQNGGLPSGSIRPKCATLRIIFPSAMRPPSLGVRRISSRWCGW